MTLKGSKTEDNLKDAFAGESQANRRYLYFANKADIEGYNDVASVFRSTAEGETGHAHGHLEYLEAVGDPATGLPIGETGDNLKAAIFTSGYREAVRLLPLMGADPETALSAAGIGDLFVTATSAHGRNRGMGERLGLGQTLKQAESEMVMVSEGVRAARMFKNLFAAKGIDAPFVGAVCALLDESASIEQFLEQAVG